MKLVSIEGSAGKAELDGVARRVALDMVPNAKVGDYVLVHAGYAIQALDEQAAEEQLAMVREVLELSNERD
jgi:hydrogenase expression/formation protein HypC